MWIKDPNGFLLGKHYRDEYKLAVMGGVDRFVTLAGLVSQSAPGKPYAVPSMGPIYVRRCAT